MSENARIVSLVARKGGSGKTTLAMLLSHGLGLEGHPVIMFETDTDASGLPLQIEGHHFLHAKLSQEAQAQAGAGDGALAARELEDIIGKAEGMGAWLVIDGGANRQRVDDLLAQISDLVLVPAGPSLMDIQRTTVDVERLRQAKANLRVVLSMWPGDKANQKSLLEQGYIREFLSKINDVRLSQAVTQAPSITKFTKGSAEERAEVSPFIAAKSRQFAQAVMGELGVQGAEAETA